MHDLGRTVMITQFRINHFKSLMMKKPVTLNPGLNLMIGLNSSGKSTFLQAIDFVSALPCFGGYSSWLDKRGWEAKDLACRVKSGPRSRSMPLIELRPCMKSRVIICPINGRGRSLSVKGAAKPKSSITVLGGMSMPRMVSSMLLKILIL